MAQADVQVPIPGTSDAPFDYQIPQSVEFLLKSVRASFDGSGAAAAFLPAVELIAPGGASSWLVPTDSAVAAGGSADVTFAPFLRNAPAATPAAAAAIYATAPQVMPLFASEFGPSDFVGWSNVRVDNTLRSNAARTNQSGFHTAAVGDYMTFNCTLGPKGALWAVIVACKFRPDGGKFLISLASLASPDPNRPAPNEGTLTDGALTYVSLLSTVDTYSPVAADGTNNGTLGALRIRGVDGAPFTTFTPGGDGYTGAATIDGGSGVYKLQLKCTGKNGASTGFVCDITYLALVRLDDNGYF